MSAESFMDSLLEIGAGESELRKGRCSIRHFRENAHSGKTAEYTFIPGGKWVKLVVEGSRTVFESIFWLRPASRLAGEARLCPAKSIDEVGLCPAKSPGGVVRGEIGSASSVSTGGWFDLNTPQRAPRALSSIPILFIHKILDVLRVSAV